jgi:hypothetical protein
MRRGASILLMLLGVVFASAAVVLWWPHLGGGLADAVAASPPALALHLAGAILFASGGAGIYSRPMTPLFFVFSLVLPLVGMLTVLGLNRVLSGSAGPVTAEDDLEVGNPILGRGLPGVAEVFLQPIARMMRERDGGSIGRMILGLSKGGMAERGHQVLRRFQQDSDVELQFYAQNAQRGATEGLELHLKNLSAKLADQPEDEVVRSALAEVLIELAGRRTTSGSDANSYVRRALEHLKQVPESARRSAMEVRGHLLVREPAGARSALEKLPGDDVRRGRLEAEVLFAERDWKRLADFAEGLESTDIRLRTARAFWRKSA